MDRGRWLVTGSQSDFVEATAAASTDASSRIRLEGSWKQFLISEFEQPYMKGLRDFLNAEKQAGKSIYPRGSEYFQALNSTPFEEVKVVVLGQDPYHGPGQAHGLSFSVLPGTPFPPSLINIFKELQTDVGVPVPAHGCLSHWAEQGVLLLNSVLTVEAGKAGSHQGRGWEIFTDRIVRELASQREGLVFLLWGSYAHKKGQFIDRKRHLVLSAVHPSPLSAYRGFFGCKHFSQTNAFLLAHGKKPIDWTVSPRS
ncbi:Uracil-DNA glycosylase [gamma proteobacterium HdN1]|nr:Uracil-DNA glycosylase [gamma proteobacterium HdN1]